MHIFPQDGHAEPILPGILAGWRPDLQGKERPESLNRKQDKFVKTKHGQVQGFTVDLYDDPDPESLYRPGSEFIERVRGTTVVFLGIPYAQPPTYDGRFKVSFTYIRVFIFFYMLQIAISIKLTKNSYFVFLYGLE